MQPATDIVLTHPLAYTIAPQYAALGCQISKPPLSLYFSGFYGIIFDYCEGQMGARLNSSTTSGMGTRFAPAMTLFATVVVAFALCTSVLTAVGGIVDFENFSNSLVYTNSVHNGPATGLITGDHAYYFALLSGFTNATTIDATLDNGTPLANGGWVYEDIATNTPTPGLLNGNYTTDPGVDVSQSSGDPANFVVVGWSANIGTTYAQAKAWWNNGNPNSGPSGYFAISGIATDVVVGGGPYPVPTIFGPTPGYEIQGFTLNLYTIPEPSTFALAGFGTAVLFILRRRK